MESTKELIRAAQELSFMGAGARAILICLEMLINRNEINSLKKKLFNVFKFVLFVCTVPDICILVYSYFI